MKQLVVSTLLALGLSVPAVSSADDVRLRKTSDLPSSVKMGEAVAIDAAKKMVYEMFVEVGGKRFKAYVKRGEDNKPHHFYADSNGQFQWVTDPNTFRMKVGEKYLPLPEAPQKKAEDLAVALGGDTQAKDVEVCCWGGRRFWGGWGWGGWGGGWGGGAVVVRGGGWGCGGGWGGCGGWGWNNWNNWNGGCGGWGGGCGGGCGGWGGGAAFGMMIG